jgi:hypothetical protein
LRDAPGEIEFLDEIPGQVVDLQHGLAHAPISSS